MMKTVADMTYDRIVANLWSAGIEVDPDEKTKMRTSAWQAARKYVEEGCIGLEETVEQKVREHLTAMGHSPSEERSPRMLGVKQHHSDQPQPGDAVQLTGEWSCVPAGDFLTLSGEGGMPSYTIARGRHRMAGNHVGQTSGGPGSILPLPVSSLVATNRRRDVSFWRFRNDVLEAHGGIDFVRNVRVWEWSGDARDFGDVADAA